MNIWVIGRSYPIKQNKMRGSFELEQAKLLAKGGNKVTYIAAVFHPINKVKKWGLCTFNDELVHVYVDSILFAPERMHIHLRKFQGYIWRRLLKRVEKEQGIPDIIHVHYPGMVSIPEPILEYRSKGTKIVLTEHWTKTLQNTMDNFQRKQLIKYVNEADAVLCVGQPLKKSIIDITGTKKEITVIPNVVSNLFKVENYQKDKNYFEFIVVGRLMPVKQVDKIVQAFYEAFKCDKNVHLTIVGGGKLQKSIEELVVSKGLRQQVNMTGTLNREDTAKKISQADALICFSKCETFGVPVIEAWACGKPVIASDSLGFLEYWNDNLGFIVPHSDIKELEIKMVELYGKSKEYDSEYISEFAQNNFGEQAILNRLMKIYKSIL